MTATKNANGTITLTLSPEEADHLQYVCEDMREVYAEIDGGDVDVDQTEEEREAEVVYVHAVADTLYGLHEQLVLAANQATKTIWRVSYYTMQGGRVKEYDNEQDARAFYDRHIAKHPEYQTSSWGKTEIVSFERMV